MNKNFKNMSETREHIITTSLKLFLQKNFKEVTMKEIVDAAGLSKGAFYHYFESKEKVFEEVVKHFYNHFLISDYSNFPKTSLKDFYKHYIKMLNAPNEFDSVEIDTNIFVFLSEASKKIPNFLEIHSAQRKKERWAWTKIIETAKRNKEIKTHIPNKDLASMFLLLGDATVMDTFSQKQGGDVLKTLRKNWEHLYGLIKASKKQEH
ncbi:MAG: TetR/AcrR family transcriptional regulator [Prevotellaceae bacterium]|jgi:AcrR family transcriptional regulator|nr:TetR/AcrR family transcriptional regulator [Prevotellaceae bacterium]